MKTIKTLVKDIYDVVERKGGWDAVVSEAFRNEVSDAVDTRLVPHTGGEEPRRTLRLSALGTPCARKLWLQVNGPLGNPAAIETISPAARLKFLYGDILEALLINLARAAGHRVEGCQDELYVNGVKGHRDCVIDGITVDVKSASTFSFKKFETGGLRDDDPFGYISQLSSYVYAGRSHEVESHPTLGAFLVIDKTLGHICLDMYDFGAEIERKEQEVEAIKTMVADPTPPGTLEDEPHQKSGNRKLKTICSYCDFKRDCFPDMRTFLSSRGPLFLTHVEREPKMEEVQ